MVGRPLAALLANDGARVFSVDIDSIQVRNTVFLSTRFMRRKKERKNKEEEEAFSKELRADADTDIAIICWTYRNTTNAPRASSQMRRPPPRRRRRRRLHQRDDTTPVTSSIRARSPCNSVWHYRTWWCPRSRVRASKSRPSGSKTGACAWTWLRIRTSRRTCGIRWAPRSSRVFYFILFYFDV